VPGPPCRRTATTPTCGTSPRLRRAASLRQVRAEGGGAVRGCRGFQPFVPTTHRQGRASWSFERQTFPRPNDERRSVVVSVGLVRRRDARSSRRFFRVVFERRWRARPLGRTSLSGSQVPRANLARDFEGSLDGGFIPLHYPILPMRSARGGFQHERSHRW